jgi:hypothetical protein
MTTITVSRPPHAPSATRCRGAACLVPLTVRGRRDPRAFIPRKGCSLWFRKVGGLNLNTVELAVNPYDGRTYYPLPHKGLTDRHLLRGAYWQPIVTDYHWVRLVSGPRGEPIVTDYHWVRLVSGPRGEPIVTDPHWVRLVSGPRGEPIVTDPHWVRLVSGPRGGPIVTDYHWVRLVSGPRGEPIVTDYHWVRLVSGPRARPIVTDYHWVRLVSGASGRANRYRLPLGSFGLGASGRANRYSLPLGSFGREGRRPDPCFLDQTIHNLHFTQFSWFRRSSGRRQPSGRRSVPIATEPREMTIQDTIGDGASAFLASYRPASVSLGTLGYPRTHGFLGSRMGADESIRSSCYKFMC